MSDQVNKAKRFVLLDLDGTLVDSAPGIIRSFQHALREMDLVVPNEEALRWVIGPPLRVSFGKLLGKDGPVEEAVMSYRAIYREEGIFDALVYEGMPEALERMREEGLRLILCTAKPRIFAEQILPHFQLDSQFEGIYGAELDGRFDDKGELIAHILAERGLRAENGVMVGDRDNDILAAARNGMASVGVLWGFGDTAELAGSGATLLCETPEGLPATVTELLKV